MMPGKDFTMMCHAPMPMRWVGSVEIFGVLDRLETDTIGPSLGNGVSAMAVLGTGLTPLMYEEEEEEECICTCPVLGFSPLCLSNRWSFSDCGCLLRWMPMSIQRRVQGGFSGAPRSR